MSQFFVPVKSTPRQEGNSQSTRLLVAVVLVGVLATSGTSAQSSNQDPALNESEIQAWLDDFRNGDVGFHAAVVEVAKGTKTSIVDPIANLYFVASEQQYENPKWDVGIALGSIINPAIHIGHSPVGPAYSQESAALLQSYLGGPERIAGQLSGFSVTWVDWFFEQNVALATESETFNFEDGRVRVAWFGDAYSIVYCEEKKACIEAMRVVIPWLLHEGALTSFWRSNLDQVREEFNEVRLQLDSSLSGREAKPLFRQLIDLPWLQNTYETLDRSTIPRQDSVNAIATLVFLGNFQNHAALQREIAWGRYDTLMDERDRLQSQIIAAHNIHANEVTTALVWATLVASIAALVFGCRSLKSGVVPNCSIKKSNKKN